MIPQTLIAVDRSARAVQPGRQLEGKAMGNFRLFQTVVRFVVATVTLAAATSVEAQVSPEFFLDDFEDRNIQDDMPVSWSVLGLPQTLADASTGDLVVTPHEAIFVAVDSHTYDNVSIRTQVAIPPDKPWFLATLLARGNLVDGTRYTAGITSSTNQHHPNSLVIGGYISDFETLYHEPTDLNPAETDVLLQFDVLGDQLTLTAWAAGTPKESGQRVSVRDSRLTQGLIGVAYWDDCCFVGPRETPTPATYRFFEAAAILPGDFNVNDVLDVEDIDLLSYEIRRGRYRPQFDLNDDESVDLADHEIWVHDVKNTWIRRRRPER